MATYYIVAEDRSPLGPNEINAGDTVLANEGDVFIIQADVDADIDFEAASGSSTNFEIQFATSNSNGFDVKIDSDLNATITIADNVELDSVVIDADKADSVNLTAGDNVTLDEYKGSKDGVDEVVLGDNFTTNKDFKTEGGDDSLTIGENVTAPLFDLGGGTDTVVTHDPDANINNAENVEIVPENYSIWVLGENDITISGGGQLDGVTQGNGSHLVGLGITLDNPNWAPVAIEDDDTAFQDNDNGQFLDGAQTINQVNYASGTVVEAEYSLLVTDGTNFYTLVAFNVNDSSPAYATVEGLAFIGEPSSWPPVGVQLTVVGAFEGPVYDSSEYVTPICFAAGTLIETPSGPRQVQNLKPGDPVSTYEGGQAVLRWIGRRPHRPRKGEGPIRFRAGAIGNTRDLVVSPQHRIYVDDWRTLLFLGMDSALIAAKDFVDGNQVVQEDVDLMVYVHLLFDRHEIVVSEGVPSESLYPGPCALETISPVARAEVLSIFPELGEIKEVAPRAAPLVRSFEARVLVAA